MNLKNILKVIVLSIFITINIQAKEFDIVQDSTHLKIESIKFKNEKYRLGSYIELTLMNISLKKIIAFKGNIICKDPFGDEVINRRIVSRSANIMPKKTVTQSWKMDYFSTESHIVSVNNADNFTCLLSNQEIVFNKEN